MVNTSQQVGGSIGTALLSTLAASAVTDYLVTHGAGPAAAVQGYTTAFWWAAGIYAAGALVCGALFRTSTRPATSHGAAEAAGASS